MLERALRLPRRPSTSFFLWGPRQTGKSTLLRATYPGAHTIDLLGAREFVRLTRDPGVLREEVESSRTRFVIIDEIQKVPGLLDEVHWLIENRRTVFALCGSSARKVRRGHANLLGGRALRYELHGLVSAELGDRVDFIVDDLRAAIEAKATSRVHADHLRGIRELVKEHPCVGRRVVVSLDERPRRTADGIDILPARTFVERLWADALIAP